MTLNSNPFPINQHWTLIPIREVSLPNGHTLYIYNDPASGCRMYYSDEVGGGVMVWMAGIVSPSTLLAAIIEDERIETFNRTASKTSPSTDSTDNG